MPSARPRARGASVRRRRRGGPVDGRAHAIRAGRRRRYCWSIVGVLLGGGVGLDVVELLRDVDVLHRRRLGDRALGADVRRDGGVDRRGDVRVRRDRAGDRRREVRVGVDVDVRVEQAAAVEQRVHAAGDAVDRPPTPPTAPPTPSVTPPTAPPRTVRHAADRTAGAVGRAAHGAADAVGHAARRAAGGTVDRAADAVGHAADRAGRAVDDAAAPRRSCRRPRPHRAGRAVDHVADRARGAVDHAAVAPAPARRAGGGAGVPSAAVGACAGVVRVAPWSMVAFCGAVASALPLMPWSIEPSAARRRAPGRRG